MTSGLHTASEYDEEGTTKRSPFDSRVCLRFRVAPILGSRRQLLPVSPNGEPRGRRAKITKPCVLRLPIWSLHPHTEHMNPHKLLIKKKKRAFDGKIPWNKDSIMMNKNGVMNLESLWGVYTLSSSCT